MAEARAAGADATIAQGSEAGGHREAFSAATARVWREARQLLAG